MSSSLRVRSKAAEFDFENFNLGLRFNDKQRQSILSLERVECYSSKQIGQLERKLLFMTTNRLNSLPV